MGTVGLSFGSPTSGEGFNVSTTVAAIVANLAAVETPWKTQLSALESQDTALSSLGTALSSLSNDMSQLTEFNGVLAQKTGSSSDTNVLELTSATSSAVAGTHTVVVNSLATTASGYLAEVSSSSSTLSGSVTLQVGNGTAQTFTIGAAQGSPASNTVYTGASGNTLAKLASAINSSTLGITANVESDSSGTWLSLTSGTSGASGNIAVSKNTLGGTGQILSYSGAAGTDASGSASATTSSGTLAAVGSSDALSGSISIQTGSGSPITVAMSDVKTATGGTTAGDLATYLQDNDASAVTAKAVTNSDGTVTLSLTSLTAGSAGTLTVNSSLADTASSVLGYTSTVTGADANLTIDGKANIRSSSNTVTNMIPGLTFQLLSASSTPVQVIIGNDNAGVESAVAQMVSDYNSLVSTVNAQETVNSSGTAEPLFGSPTLTLLQQQLMSGLNLQNPNGYLTPITANSSTVLSGSITLQAGTGMPVTVVIGAAPSTPEANTIYTGSGADTLQDLVNAINGANSSTPVSYTAASSGTSGTIAAGATTQLAGALTLQAGNGTAETIYLGPSSNAPTGDLATGTSQNTLSSLADFIANNATLSALGITASSATDDSGNSTMTLSSGSGALAVNSDVDIPGLGVTAGVTTSGGQSTLALSSQTAGSAGALKVTSSLSATSATALAFTENATTTGSDASGVLDTIPAASDILTGSITIQAGNGTAQTVSLGSSGGNLEDLANLISDAGIGVAATVKTNSNGTAYLSIQSQTTGSLTVTSSLLDTSNPATADLSYTNSSDLSTLANLGITVSQSDDGTLSFDDSVLDSVLNSDYSSVVGFFQNVNSWGQSFSTTLENAGSSSSTGILSLAKHSNSNMESTLNADIGREQSLIGAQQASLTNELNSANEIMQELPSELTNVNELYSAITGYNENSNG